MSKGVKKVASIALPILGTLFFPGVGTAIGSALGATGAAASAVGGAVLGGAGGAIGGGGVKGALTGAALGGIGGYVSGAGGLANAAQNVGLGATGAIGPTISGSPLPGASGLAGLISGASRAVGGGSGISNLALLSGGINAASGIYSADAAKEAAQIQSASADRAMTQQTQSELAARQQLQPYVDAGTNTLKSYQSLVNDPSAQAQYIQSNPFYKTMADDAEKRLLANQAARGKVGSGGTASELQNQLTLLGQQLLQQQIGNQQNIVSSGQNAATGVGNYAMTTGNNLSNLITQQGNVNAAGQTGAANAYTNAAQSTINSLVELQKLQNPYSSVQYGTSVRV